MALQDGRPVNYPGIFTSAMRQSIKKFTFIEELRCTLKVLARQSREDTRRMQLERCDGSHIQAKDSEHCAAPCSAFRLCGSCLLKDLLCGHADDAVGNSLLYHELLP